MATCPECWEDKSNHEEDCVYGKFGELGAKLTKWREMAIRLANILEYVNDDLGYKESKALEAYRALVTEMEDK